jgi:hypothetical protein
MVASNMRPPILLIQPSGSYCCGQACIGMLLGWSIEDVQKVMGKKGKTRTKDIVKFLNDFGCKCSMRRIFLYGRSKSISSGILWLKHPTLNKFHWVLLWRGNLYDPDGCTITQGWKVLSAIPVSYSPYLGDG